MVSVQGGAQLAAESKGQAVTGVLAGNNLAGALASGASPYLATEIRKLTTTNGQVNVAANAMAHAVLGAVTAQLNNQSAAAGGLGAGGGELAARYILEQLYPGKTTAQLSESEKQQVSALATLASGLAGGVATGDTAGAVTGSQAGKNAVENNALGAVVQGGKLAAQGCAKVAACRDALVEKGLGALLGVGAANTVLDNLSATDREYVFNVAMTGKADLIEKLTPEQRVAYDYMVGQDQKGLITIFPQPDRELTGGKLINPVQDQNKGSSLTTPDQRDQNGASHTGNTSGSSDTGVNTTTTPIPDGTNKDDFIYMSDGHMLGANGVKFPSKTIWKGEGKERIDVENPNPGQRPGQVHYQDNKNNKYYYDPNNNNFYGFDSTKSKVPAPSSVNKLLDDPKFKQAIDKGMKQYLGEK